MAHHNVRPDLIIPIGPDRPGYASIKRIARSTGKTASTDTDACTQAHVHPPG